jgi:hypothetical protein
MVVGARVDGSQCSTRWWQHGAVDAARAHQSSALHDYGAMFLVGFLPTKPAGCEELTKGVFNRRGAPEQDARWQGCDKPLTMVGGSSKGWITTRL